MTLVLQVLIVGLRFVPFDPDDLLATAEPLVVTDVRGEVIATLPARGADRTHWIALGQIPTIALSAVVESEDQRFWDHGGVDGLGLARALWLDLRGGRYGGSTLTMQLARMLISEGKARTLGAKVSESVLALRIERAVDKRAILEQWMNRAYFGNGAHGFEAAARLYFGKPAAALSDGEATLLAVVPRAPAAYDPLKHLDAALRRRDYVLDLLVARGAITEDVARDARAQPLAVNRHAPVNHAPHFVAWALEQLPAGVRARGGTVRTTLDLQLQRTIQTRVAEQVAQLASLHLEQAAVVVLDGATLEVRAMVGSTAWTARGGQINFATRRRHPGSALKPFVYATAIENGATPASIAWDTRDTSDNYFAPSGAEHGPVRYREALASSYNFAAIEVIEQVGLGRVMTNLRRAGVAELAGNPDTYGLRLALGSAKVRLVDLAAGYGFLVNEGRVTAPRGLAGATLPDGTTWTPPRPIPQRVFSPETAWLVADMLSDPEARRPGFGMELPLDLPFRIAAKTGTARGFADTWAVGATREAIVGAWAGAVDGAPTHGIVGMDAAAPLVRAAMLALANGHRLTLPPRPDTVGEIEVCAVSGGVPGEGCPRVHDYAAHGHGPTETCAWHDRAGHLTYPARAKGWLARARARHEKVAGHEVVTPVEGRR
ncbi:MAG: transglycosylase domain-containing protein [Deltaproteobacteria bacterium]|nr:transglycosylase domain-containing protein [Deltaproteobacteria bacterium]